MTSQRLVKNKVYQFRRERGSVGRPHQVYFCEIHAPNKKEAMRIVKETPLNNLRWRWIDSFDLSQRDYDEVSFECRL